MLEQRKLTKKQMSLVDTLVATGCTLREAARSRVCQRRIRKSNRKQNDTLTACAVLHDATGKRTAWNECYCSCSTCYELGYGG